MKLGVALILMGCVGYYLAAQVNWLQMRHHVTMRWFALFGVVFACMTAYFGALFAMGFRYRDFRKISH